MPGDESGSAWLPEPARATQMRSPRVVCPTPKPMTCVPSGVMDEGHWLVVLLVIRSAVPVPSAASLQVQHAGYGPT